MLTQSKETRNAWRASQRTLDIKVTIDGKTYGATDINSLKYDSGAYNGDTFAIGSTYSNTVQIEFSHLIEGLKLGMEVHPSIGIKTSSGYVYEPLGVFIISSEIKMDRNNNLTTVSASDRFCGLEGTYVSKLTYPAKVLDVIAEICAQSGVKANTDDLARLPHQADLSAPITGQSYRKALGWIAQLYVGYALFDRQGLFTIRTISEPNYELDPSQYEQAGLTKNEAAYKINGIQCQVTLTTKTRDGESTEETKNYQAGDATGSQIKLENNIMTPQRLNDIWEQLKDITFYPFSLNWFGNPAVEAGDWLRLEDKQGNSFVVPNSSYTLDFNGGLSATSKADQTTSSDQMVPWQGSVAQTIKELQLRRVPDGTVVFPPSVTAPPTNAKFNDVWFRKNGNATELWVFEKQDDGSGKWVRKDLTEDEIKHQIEQAQAGLNQAKSDIITNKQKADADIENLNKSIEANKSAADESIEKLNKSIADNKKVADDSLQKLSDSITKLQGQYDNNIVPDLTKVTNDVADALQKYISAQNNIADLTKQAQAQGKNIADVTNTVKGLNINYANLLGDVNSTKVDVKGLQTTVGTANGDIAQLKLDAQNLQTMLAGKVDNTTYTNFVNLTNKALDARLTASDLNGYAKTADVQATANGLRVDLNSVTDRMNNLKVGGRNLIPNSGTDIVIESKTTDPYPAWDNKAVYWDLTPGETYTFSASATNTNGVKEASIRIWNSAVNKEAPGNLVFPADGRRHSTTFTIPKDGVSYSVYLYAGHMGKLEGKNFATTYHHPMLQIGNAGTEWSPNPQDIQNDLSQLSARITTTSQQFSSYYTKSETDSKADTAKNDAVNAIKSDSNWTGLKNVLTNSGFLQTADGFLQKVQQTTIPMFSGGGVNLARNTSDKWSSAWSDFNGSNNQTKQLGRFYTRNLNVGDWITIAVNYQYQDLSGSGMQIALQADGNVCGWNDGAIYPSDWQQLQASSTLKTGSIERHIKVTPSLIQNEYYAVQLRVDNASGGWLRWIYFQVNKGTVRPPWSPAPEDMATQSAFSELSQSLEGLRSTVGSNYGGLQSQISQSASEMRTDLTNKITGLQTQLTTTANGLDAKIGAIQVGGRNLLRNSNKDVSVTSRTTDGWPAWCNYNTGFTFEHGQTYTFSVEARNSTSKIPEASIRMWESSTNIQGYFHAFPADGKRHSITFTIPDDSHNYQLLYYAGHAGQVPGVDVTTTYHHPKLELGTMATDWTPAPEDTDQAFTEVNATINGLQSTVGSNYGSLQSQISQSSSAVRTELVDKINGVDNKTTSTANSLNSVIGRVGSLENLTNFQVINNAINVNDYTKTGNYFIQSTSNTNVPATNWCYLKVEKVNDGRIVQTWQADSDPTLRYVRTKFGDSWTQWQRSASYLEYSELNRTVQGLQSTVSSNHNDLQSQISQTAKTIRQEVSDKTSGLQTQINQQANNFNVSLNSLRKETAWQKVTSAIDANNYKTTGNYWIQAVPNSNTPDSSAWAYLQVVAYPDVKRIKQTWQRDNNENEIYTRLLIGDNWTSWQRTVTGGNIMAQINMSAGTTLIQNDKIYMDASSTIFSGNAFIPSAAITSLNADKITAGTLDAGRINVINLNANNITAGTLRGSNGEFYLDSGALHVWQGDHNAWIDKNGIHDSDNSGNNVWISNGSISAYGNSSGAYLFDGGLYLHKSQSLSDAVLNPNYGSITKSDNIVSFGTSGLDIDGKDGFLLRTHGWNDQTLAYLNGNEIIGAGIAGKSDGFMNIAAKKQLFLYAGEPVQNDKLKTIPKLVLDGTYQNGQTALKGTFSQYFFQGPSSGFSGGITLQDEFVNVGSLNGKNYFSISSDGAISITANGKSILSLNGLFPGVNGDFNVSGNFTVTGSKNAVVPTSRGMAAINAYETAEYYFGDIGETQTNSNGVVTVMIDPYFLETVNTLVPYQVFLTPYGNGNVWVSSRSANNFTVKSSNPNIHFAWEIKAKRKGYENDRMKIVKGVFNNEQY